MGITLHAIVAAARSRWHAFEHLEQRTETPTIRILAGVFRHCECMRRASRADGSRVGSIATICFSGGAGSISAANAGERGVRSNSGSHGDFVGSGRRAPIHDSNTRISIRNVVFVWYHTCSTQFWIGEKR